MTYYSSSSVQWSDPELAKLNPPSPKPEELIFLEQLEISGLSFLAGGYVDQPYPLMEILAVAGRARAMYHPKGGA